MRSFFSALALPVATCGALSADADPVFDITITGDGHVLACSLPDPAPLLGHPHAIYIGFSNVPGTVDGVEGYLVGPQFEAVSGGLRTMRFFAVSTALLCLSATLVAHADPLVDVTFSEAGQTFDLSTPETTLQKIFRPPADRQLFLNGVGTLNGTPGYSYQWITDLDVGVSTISVHSGRFSTFFSAQPLTFLSRGPEVPFPGPPTPDCGTPCRGEFLSLLPGTYDLFDNFRGGEPITLTIVPETGGTVTPEPETLWLLGTGMVAGMAGLRRRLPARLQTRSRGKMGRGELRDEGEQV